MHTRDASSLPLDLSSSRFFSIAGSLLRFRCRACVLRFFLFFLLSGIECVVCIGDTWRFVAFSVYALYKMSLRSTLELADVSTGCAERELISWREILSGELLSTRGGRVIL